MQHRRVGVNELIFKIKHLLWVFIRIFILSFNSKKLSFGKKK